MKYLLIALGTRGDIEPFLAIGEYLKGRGHQVFGAFPEQFKSIALESGIEFRALDKAFIELIEGAEGKIAMGGTKNLIQRIQAYYKLYKMSKDINYNLFQEQFNYLEEIDPDRVIHSIKASVPIQWGLKTKKPVYCLSPVPCITHPVKNRSSMVFHGRNFGNTLNKWSYGLTRYATIKNLRTFLKKLKKEDPGQRALVEAMLNEPTIFTVSPHFFNLTDQPSHVHHLGYQERDKTLNWKPDKNLNTFLEEHEKFLFLTFGSMSNPEPERVTKLILQELINQGIPALINIAQGGLVEPQSYDSEQFCFVKNIPYDWILPKSYAIIHHGGSGTTHLGLKYGCATTIIPHIIDQFFWNNVLSELGVGPKGTGIARLNQRNFKNIIQPLWNDTDHKLKAKKISQKVSSEDYKERIIQILTS